MGHCVVSYSDQCADGHASVWSIGLQREEGGEREAVLTVAVDPKRRVVTQARGRYNMLPNQAPRSAQAQKADSNGYAQMINRSANVLQRWCEYERLRRED